MSDRTQGPGPRAQARNTRAFYVVSCWALGTGRWALTALLLGAGAAGAATDAERIEIRADSAELDQAAARSIYRGDVVLTRDNLELRGDELVVVRDGEDGVTAVLTGDPAHLSQRSETENAEPVTGSAERMTYKTARERIELQGGAVVRRGGNAMQGEIITHDLVTGRTTANRIGEEEGERVRIILDPPPGDETDTGTETDTEAMEDGDAS